MSETPHTTAPSEVMVLTRPDVLDELRELFPKAMVYALDLSYAVVSEVSLVTFAAELAEDLKAARVMGWDDQYDCEDFAIAALHLAKRKHWLAGAAGITTAGAPTVGLLLYLQDGRPGMGHAINIVRTRAGWSAWEPQTQKLFELTTAERGTAWMVMC